MGAPRIGRTSRARDSGARGSSEPKNTRLFSLGETFANIDFLDDSASCWSISNLEQKVTRLFSLCETFANLWFVWFGSDRRACEVRLRQCLLGIQRCIRFDRSPRQLLGRMAPASSARDSASALRDGGPSQLREVLCMSSRRSSSSPSSSQQWAEVTSSLNGVCSRDSTFQPPCARYRRFRCCPDSVSDTLTGQAVVPPVASRSCGAGGTGPGAARGGPGEVLREAHPSSIPKPQRRTAGRLWHISCRRHRAPLPPFGPQPRLPLQERDWLRPGRRSWPCCSCACP